MSISWKYGDTPLPLNAGGMDLTGATVTVYIRDASERASQWFVVESTVPSGATGDVSVMSSSIPVGIWMCETKVHRGGTLVATFPNDGTRQIITVTPSSGGSTPLPFDGQVILDGGTP